MRPVVRIFRGVAEELTIVSVRTPDELAAIKSTTEHPFFVKDRGWIPASSLTAGDVLVCESGELGFVEEVVILEERVEVYNFEVAELHNYFVSDAKILVHNQSWRLIGADRAEIDPRKLTDYALNPNHPVGGGKARVFQSALGYNQSNYKGLLSQLQGGVMNVTPIHGKVDSFGSRFTVDIPVTGPGGSATVRTGWILRPGSTTPSMTTLFVR